MPDTVEYEYKTVEMKLHIFTIQGEVQSAPRIKKVIRDDLASKGWSETSQFITHQGYYCGRSEYDGSHINQDTRQYQVWRRVRPE